MLSNISKANLSMDRLLLQAKRIRLIEQLIVEKYPLDIIQSPVHLSIGQESVAVGVCAALQKEDLLYSTYRSHAFYLAKGGDLRGFFAELMGKKTGCCQGKGGSMHLAYKDVGFMGTSAIVGSTIPVSVGAAFAVKKRRLGNLVVSVFGDGATEQGVFHESLNFASLMKLPIIFVLEDNQLAVNTPLELRQSYSIRNLVESYDVGYSEVSESYDPNSVFNHTQKIRDEVISESKPALIRVPTYRYLEHVGTSDDHGLDHRNSKDQSWWKSKDPLEVQEFDKTIISDLKQEIQSAYDLAFSDPEPTVEDLISDVL